MLFRNNSGVIGLETNNYMQELRGGTAASDVNWAGSFFDVLGIWSGNYPAAGGPIYLNVYGGTITP